MPRITILFTFHDISSTKITKITNPAKDWPIFLQGLQDFRLLASDILDYSSCWRYVLPTNWPDSLLLSKAIHGIKLLLTPLLLFYIIPAQLTYNALCQHPLHGILLTSVLR